MAGHGVVTSFEMCPREADTALFRQAVHPRLPTRPLPGVDGSEFVCERCSTFGMIWRWAAL